MLIQPVGDDKLVVGKARVVEVLAELVCRV